MPRDDTTLVDMLKACRLAMDFIAGMTKEEFLQDAKTQSATLHQLLIVGEAVKRLSDEFRAAHPTIPWKQIAGMRNVLIHHYEAVDLDEVWKTLDSDVPALAVFLEPIAPQPPDA